MDRQEFFRRLERGLSTLPYGERESALRYYEEYFDDAGRENEQRVISELGSPEALAKVIIAQSELGATRTEPVGGYQDSQSRQYGKFTSLKVNVLNAKVSVKRGEKQVVDIDYPDEAELPECEVVNGTLSIVDKKHKRLNWFGGWNTSYKQSYITITVTDENYDRFELETVNGGVVMQDFRVASLQASSVNGAVNASDIKARTIKLDNVNGAVRADSCAASESCSFSTVNGSVNAGGDLRGDISASAVNGSVRLTVKRGDYDLKLSTVSGSVRLNGQKQSKSTTIMCGAKNRICANTVNGSIHVDYE